MGSRVVAADGPLEPEGAVERVLTGYRRYLLLERGLSDATAASHEPRARLFLSARHETRYAEIGITGLQGHPDPRGG